MSENIKRKIVIGKKEEYIISKEINFKFLRSFYDPFILYIAFEDEAYAMICNFKACSIL